MTFKVKNVVYIFIALTTIILGVCSSFFLPEKYYFDANLIRFDPWNEKGLIGSYSFAMWFYDILRLNRLEYYFVAIVQLPIIFYLLSRLGIPNIFGKLVLRNIIVWTTMLIFAVYLSIPSKEFINFVYILIISLVLISPYKLVTKLIIVNVMFIFLGLWYRPYFSLIPILGIGLYLGKFIKIRNKVVFNIISGLLIACFISLSYGLIKGEFMSQSSREKLNKRRVGREDSQTIIVSPIETDTFIGESVGVFYGFFSVNFPVNGLKFFYKPQVMAFILWQMLMFVYLIYYYHKCLRKKKEYLHEEWFFHFTFAYLIVQGVFEPDLGSAVKHKLGVFPLIYLALYYDQDLVKRTSKSIKYVIRKIS